VGDSWNDDVFAQPGFYFGCHASKKIGGKAPHCRRVEIPRGDPSFQNTCSYFASAVCYLLLYTVLKEELDTGKEAYRNTAVAAIAARKMMLWYRDPYTRVSMPSAAVPPSREVVDDEVQLTRRSPRDFQFHTALKIFMESLPADPVDKTSVVPGLSIQHAIEIITTEPTWHTLIFRQEEPMIESFLEDSFEQKPMAWKAFSSGARAAAAHLIVGFFRDMPEPSDMVVTKNIVWMITGFNQCGKRDDEVMWLKVVKLSMTKKSATGINFPFGGHTDFFERWFDEIHEEAGSLLDVLEDDLLVECDGFSRELIPPKPVLEHIIEYAMLPFPDV